LADLGIPISMPELDIALRREFEGLFGATIRVAIVENATESQ
jgi:hypothetical protein